MDPTKNFDHLDPKLKETYARVMGTTTGGPGDTTQAPAPSVNSMPPAAPQANQTPSQFANAQLSMSQNPPMGPNPGTGPTVNNIPTDTTAMFSPAATQPAQTEPPANGNAAPASSSFFSNPSPVTTNPTQASAPTSIPNVAAPVTPATEPAPVPVTPYSPDNQQYPPFEQGTQPLPSPSSITQKGAHETSALLRVLYIIGAVIFFAIYTVFWIKVFNLPFLF